uniref:Uncharacterized protein n=1 Tax=Anguilla anguilla TaxID=7936 RepID=A0A0E9TZ60_ANGAN
MPKTVNCMHYSRCSFQCC